MTLYVALIIISCTFDIAHAPLPDNIYAFVSQERHRTGLIKAYFKQGYAYKDIVLFLATIHGIKIGIDRLKQILCKLGLRRRQPKNEDTVGPVLEAVRDIMEESGKLYDKGRLLSFFLILCTVFS